VNHFLMRGEGGDELAIPEASNLPFLTFADLVRSFRYANRCLLRM
jgi:hypothetical protein